MGKHKVTVPILAAVALASLILAAWHTEAAPPKGGKAAAHMNAKGRSNTNAQWTADPDKGWVPASGVQRLDKNKTENSKRNHINRKGDGSKKNF